MRVLLAEDDIDTLDLAAYALRKEGFEVLTARDGQQALKRWERDEPDIVVLDATLPKVDGYEVCRVIRQAERTPVIVLAPRDDEDDILRGFANGADDCLGKPINLRALSAKMKRINWRYTGRTLASRPCVIRTAGFELDVEAHQVRRRDHCVELTPLECRILYLLALNVGRTVTYSNLLDHAWGYGRGEASLLRAHVTNLRRKLGLGQGRRAGIRSIQSVGYALVP